MFWSGVPLGGHLTSFCCAPPDTGVSDLQLVALERLLSIEGADEIRIDVTFLRGKAPLSGELSAKLTERLQQIYSFPLSPTAPSFPPCRKRRGRKGTLGRVWCILPLILGRNQYFRRRSTRYSPYGYHTTRRLIRYTGFDGRCL